MNLSVEEGEFVRVGGPLGISQTALFELIAGLEFPDSGQVFVDSKVVERPSREVIAVFRQDTLFPWLSLLGNVEWPLRRLGLDEKDRKIRAIEAIESARASGVMHAHPHELKGALKLRGAIARALAMRPKVLLVDASCPALKPQERQSIGEELRSLWHRTKMTVLFAAGEVASLPGRNIEIP